MTVHLRIAFASENPAHLVLIESDGTVHVRMNDAARSFRRLQRDGVWWRLAGQDRATGDMVYMRELADAS